MKLSKKEVEDISKDYNLGRVSEFSLISGGLANYNFLLKTDKGEFILRFLGKEINKKKMQKIKLEFMVLDYLYKNKFRYSTPKPLRNQRRKYLSSLRKNIFWVYKKLDGERIWKINPIQFKEIAKALALYHKKISGIKCTKPSLEYEFDFILKEYKKMKRITPKNKIDKLMRRSIDLFLNQLDKYKKIDLNNNLIITHSDFSKSNMLFNENNLIAFLDFDNLEIAPKIKDIAYSIKQSCFSKDYKLDKTKMNFFLKEYERHFNITETEKEQIIPFIILDNCIKFWWFYKKMKKKLDKQFVLMLYTIKITKNLIEAQE